MDTPELSGEERAELDRRIAALDADPSRNVAWEEVKARILAWLRKHPQRQA